MSKVSAIISLKVKAPVLLIHERYDFYDGVSPVQVYAVAARRVGRVAVVVVVGRKMGHPCWSRPFLIEIHPYLQWRFPGSDADVCFIPISQGCA